MKDTIIDAKNGSIRISANFMLSKDITPEELVEHLGEANVKIRDMKNGYIHYSTSDILLRDTFFKFDLIFYSDRVKSISWVYDYYGDSWDNWSHEKELRVEKQYNDWLTQQVGLRRKLAWGDVWASFDQKGGGTSLGLRYV